MSSPQTKQDEEDVDHQADLLSLFDSLCVSFGDLGVIVRLPTTNDSIEHSLTAVSYLELQEASNNLASQLYYRFDEIDYVLVECFGHAVAEAACLLACLRLNAVVVPVSIKNHAVIETLLLNDTIDKTRIVAITCVENDQDIRLGVFQKYDIHRILFVDPAGMLREQIPVPQAIPRNGPKSDSLYILFTSGTSEATPKAVIGSHRSTYKRIQWFRQQFLECQQHQHNNHKIAKTHSLTFVDGINEIWTALVTPDTVLVSLEKPSSLPFLGDFWTRALNTLEYQPTIMTVVPTTWQQVLLTNNADLVAAIRSSLQTLIFSGELVSESLYCQTRQVLTECKIVNLYGQTESTGDVLCAVLTEMKSREHVVVNGVVAVGRPILPDVIKARIELINNTKSSDRDASNSRGELVISGNLSLGYLTATRKPNNNVALESFSTGDLAFCRNGIWYVEGRILHTEKIAGNWTNPLQVERIFCQHFPQLIHVPIGATIVNGAVYIVISPEISTTRITLDRSALHKNGVQWNLIPKQIFYHTIPTNTTGKIARSELKTLVLKLLEKKESSKSGASHKDFLANAVCNVLNMRGELDETRSFVDLGGDSVSAIALYYQIESNSPTKLQSALDILASRSITELRNMLKVTMPASKKPKLSEYVRPLFVPTRLPQIVSDRHLYIQFGACVDSQPILDSTGASFYVGCQGGMLQRVCAASCRVLSYYNFPNTGWMIQADCVIVEIGFVVCAYNASTNKGWVVLLTTDLQRVQWERQVGSCTKTTPSCMGGSLYVIGDANVLYCIELKTGKEICPPIELPTSVTATPKLCNGNDALVMTSSEWNFEKILLLEKGTNLIRQQELAGQVTMGPVYKDPVMIDSKHLAIADSWGYLHLVHTDSGVCNSCQVSLSSLSPPAILSKNTLIVGSYKGEVHCVNWNELTNELSVTWTLRIGGIVYATPLVVASTRTVVAATTAGYVSRIQDGKEIDRYRIGAEIWSDPILLNESEDGCRIAFGARDSRVHILSYPAEL